MKNLKANRTKVGLTLIASAKRCILLSGTPALSRPFELFPQIKALEPNAFGGYCNLLLIFFTCKFGNLKLIFRADYSFICYKNEENSIASFVFKILEIEAQGST